MTGAISNLAGSVSGAPAASKMAQSQKSRERDRTEKAKPKPHQSEDVVEVETAEAVRNIKDETQEEAQEDHQKHPAYGANGHKQVRTDRPRLDLNG